jgi:hypothetical protein
MHVHTHTRTCIHTLQLRIVTHQGHQIAVDALLLPPLAPPPPSSSASPSLTKGPSRPAPPCYQLVSELCTSVAIAAHVRYYINLLYTLVDAHVLFYGNL